MAACSSKAHLTHDYRGWSCSGLGYETIHPTIREAYLSWATLAMPLHQRLPFLDKYASPLSHPLLTKVWRPGLLSKSH